MTDRFALVDWGIVAVYLLAIVGVGTWVGSRRKSAEGAGELFLAGRSMPVWAVAISVLATAQSAATFIGGPQQSYAGNLTYLSANLGGLLAALILARWFLPAFYRANVTSIYEFIGARLGNGAQRGTALAFLVGRVLASGARLFIVGLAFALVVFGDTTLPATIGSIVIIATAATVYTSIGGIRAVIWTDVLQALLVFVAVIIALVTLRQHIPAGADAIVDALRDTPDGNKLRAFDLTFDWTSTYTVWTALVGFTLFNLAAFGTDQDLTQRMLTCPSAGQGGRAAILGVIIGWPVITVFLMLGLLLYVGYERADVMGDAILAKPAGDSRTIFLGYILSEIPAGWRGLMVAGLFAAAMSSTDSALNAMASVLVTDLKKRRATTEVGSSVRERRHARVAMIAAGAALAACACTMAWVQARSESTLIDFALGVMVLAYGGLLGVFLAAIFTKRGSSASAVAALIVGAVVTIVLSYGSIGNSETLAFPWRMTAATAASFAVCVSADSWRRLAGVFLLGFVVTITSSTTVAVMGPLFPGYQAVTAHPLSAEDIQTEWERLAIPAWRDERPIRGMRIRRPFRDECGVASIDHETPRLLSIHEHFNGWPWPALRDVRYVEQFTRLETMNTWVVDGIDLPIAPILGTRCALPLGLLAGGLLLDSMFFAAALLFGGWLFGAARRFLRRCRGRCPQCGHDWRGTTNCPECGARAG